MTDKYTQDKLNALRIALAASSETENPTKFLELLVYAYDLSDNEPQINSSIYRRFYTDLFENRYYFNNFLQTYSGLSEFLSKIIRSGDNNRWLFPGKNHYSLTLFNRNSYQQIELECLGFVDEPKTINSACFIDNNNFVTAHTNGEIIFWNIISQNKKTDCIKENYKIKFDEQILEIVCAANEIFIADKKQIWQLKTGEKQPKALLRFANLLINNEIRKATFSTNNKYLSLQDTKRKLYLIDLANNCIIFSTKDIGFSQFSKYNTELFLINTSGEIVSYSIKTRKKKSFKKNKPSTFISSGHNESTYIIGDYNGRITIVDNNQNILTTFSGHQARITDAKFLNENILISVSEDRTIKKWKITCDKFVLNDENTSKIIHKYHDTILPKYYFNNHNINDYLNSAFEYKKTKQPICFQEDTELLKSTTKTFYIKKVSSMECDFYHISREKLTTIYGEILLSPDNYYVFTKRFGFQGENGELEIFNHKAELIKKIKSSSSHSPVPIGFSDNNQYAVIGTPNSFYQIVYLYDFINNQLTELISFENTKIGSNGINTAIFYNNDSKVIIYGGKGFYVIDTKTGVSEYNIEFPDIFFRIKLSVNELFFVIERFNDADILVLTLHGIVKYLNSHLDNEITESDLKKIGILN